jgi:hypothetical protein
MILHYLHNRLAMSLRKITNESKRRKIKHQKEKGETENYQM